MHPHRVARPTAAQAAVGRDQQLIAAAHFGFPGGDGGCHATAAVAGNQLEEHAARVLGKSRGERGWKLGLIDLDRQETLYCMTLTCMKRSGMSAPIPRHTSIVLMKHSQHLSHPLDGLLHLLPNIAQ